MLFPFLNMTFTCYGNIPRDKLKKNSVPELKGHYFDCCVCNFNTSTSMN